MQQLLARLHQCNPHRECCSDGPKHIRPVAKPALHHCYESFFPFSASKGFRPFWGKCKCYARNEDHHQYSLLYGDESIISGILRGENRNSFRQPQNLFQDRLRYGSRYLINGLVWGENKFLDPGLWIQDPGPGSRVLDPGFCVQDEDPEFLFSGEATATVGTMY